MYHSRYLTAVQQPVSRGVAGNSVSHLLRTLLLLLLLPLSALAVELPLNKQLPATDNGDDYVLSWDHSPGWYWPTLDSLGTSRWVVSFEAPAELDVLDCRIASYGGSGDGVTISLLYLDQTFEIDTTLCGYLENGYEIFTFPEPMHIPVGGGFAIHVLYDHFFGPPFLTADNDGNGTGRSVIHNGGTDVLEDRDLCIRVGVEFMDEDPVAPELILSQLPLIWDNDTDIITSSSRVSDNSDLAEATLTLLHEGQATAVHDFGTPLAPLLVADLSDFEFMAGSGYNLALSVSDIFGNTAYDTTAYFVIHSQWPQLEQVTSGARFLDYFTTPDPVNSAGSALAVRVASSNSNLIAFQPHTVRLMLQGVQPFTVCITPDQSGRPAPDLSGSYPGGLDWSFKSVISPDPADTLSPRWLDIEFDSTAADSLFAYDEPFWVVLLYDETAVPHEQQNSFGCDTSMTGACSWRFSTSSWEYEPMTNGNLLVEVLGSGASCENLFSDSLLYEEFESAQLPLCWNNSYDEDQSVGWEFGLTETTWFSPYSPDENEYAFNNSDANIYSVIQDTLLTPVLSLDQNAVLSFQSWLRVDDLSSAEVIWRQDGDLFSSLLTDLQEATAHWDSPLDYPPEWQLESLQLDNPPESYLQFGFVYAANNPGVGCYGWAIDSVCVEDTSGATLFRWEGEWLESFEVSPVYPNPFNQETCISYRLQEADWITARVYDLLGREVRLLLQNELQSGEQVLRFDADGLASGIYFIRLQARQSGREVIRKALYLK